MRGLVPLAQHYEEALPSENAMVKESETRLQATEKRIHDMRFEALMRGQRLSLGAMNHGGAKLFQGAEKHFEGRELTKHPDAPKLTMKQLIMNSAMMRMLKSSVKQ